jgi:hypothetical protein
MKLPNTVEIRNYLLTFQETIEEVSRLTGEDEENVIREFVNSKWDIRECLDYKDIIDICETEKGE